MRCRNIQKLLAILPLLCVLLCGMPVRALALTTVLSTNVPDEVSLRVEIKRHQSFTVSLEPKSGYQVSEVRLNGKSVLVSLKDGKLVIDALNLDGTLSVTFSKIPGSWNGSNPRTGDQQVIPAMLSALISTTALLLALSRKKNG